MSDDGNGNKIVQLEGMAVQYGPPDSLHANDYNPNRQSPYEFDLLCKSIEQDGFTQPILVTPDMTIVDGEHRWRAGQTLGLDEVPYIVVPFGKAQARVSTLRHNRARGQEDAELAARVMQDLQSMSVSRETLITDLQMEPVEVDRLQQMAVPTRPQTPDSALEPGEVTERRRQANAEARKREAGVSDEEDRYFLQVQFGPEEAEIVRPVLEPEPAKRIVELCRGS